MLATLRGLGQRQSKEKDVTIGRICVALYQEPHISETLWKRTRIHKNAMVLRLNELVKNGTVIKHHPSFSTPYYLQRGFFKHNYYLLNWSKRESKDIVSRAFEAGESHSLLAFRFNSINYGSEGIGEVNPIPFDRSCIRREIKKRIIDLDIEEKSLTREMVQNYTYQNRVNVGRPVIQKREKILATLILACAYIIQSILCYMMISRGLMIFSYHYS